MTEKITFTNDLIDFINKSPTAFHATENACALLEGAGFVRIDSSERFVLVPGGKYFLTRGASSLIAFIIPEDISEISFSIAASHGDSPALKLKPSCEVDCFGKFKKLAVEKYGGAILSTWFDRPLSVAGRITYEDDGKLVSKNVNIDRDLLIIPSVPTHLGGVKEPSVNVDFLPLFSSALAKTDLASLLHSYAGIGDKEILSSDLFVYCRNKGTFLGAELEFFASPRIDDLQCVYSSLIGLTEAFPKSSVAVFAMFDNEETGSSSRPGACSTFLPETLQRIVLSLGGDNEDYLRALASSFMISADNAHGKHPCHPELFDQQNAPVLNGGIVIKTNASRKYTTDFLSFAIMKKLCEKAEVPYQSYANRADLLGGSTLGNLALHKLPVVAADIGLAQFAMHSCYESAGTHDSLYFKKLSKIFYETKIKSVSDSVYTLS